MLGGLDGIADVDMPVTQKLFLEGNEYVVVFWELLIGF